MTAQLDHVGAASDPAAARAATSLSMGEIGSITPREREILQLLTYGFGIDEVAGRLCISEKTVKNHLCALYPKLRARTRVQAIVTALCVGLVSLPSCGDHGRSIG